MSKKHILLVAPFISLKGEAYFNRFRYLAQNFVKNGYKVTLITSDFEHFTKKHRNNDVEKYKEDYDIYFIHEIGYKKNVSIFRLISHKIFCNNLNNYIKNNIEKFNIVYSAYPLICSNLVLGKYAKKYNIPLIIDIQDVWPESISAFLGKYTKIFSPVIKIFSIRANRTYSYANGLVAVSKTYLERAKKVNFTKYHEVAYIGADTKKIKNIVPVKKDENEFWITYIGTLSYSYDIETIIQTASLLKNYENIKFFIIGDGQNRDSLKKLNKKIKANVIFLDSMPYEDMISYLKSSDIGLNAIQGYAIPSITNKISDYICTNTVVLNSSTNYEIVNLIDNNKIGFNYKAGDCKELKQKIEFLYNNKNILQIYKKNINYVVNRFDRNIEYKKIYVLIKKILKEKQ